VKWCLTRSGCREAFKVTARVLFRSVRRCALAREPVRIGCDRLAAGPWALTLSQHPHWNPARLRSPGHGEGKPLRAKLPDEWNAFLGGHSSGEPWRAELILGCLEDLARNSVAD
jgi:hypothetical protein